MKRIKNSDPIFANKTDFVFSKPEYIDNLYNFITQDIEAPFAISIDGDWGTGKTTSMLFLKEKLLKEKYPVFWFNPWEYKGTNNVVLSFLQNLGKYFPDKLGKKCEKVGAFLKLLVVSGIDLGARIITNGNLSIETVNANGKILEEEDLKEWEKHHDIIREIKNEFVKLCNTLAPKEDKPLYIFIDDFDRCLPNDTVQLLEAIKNLFVAQDDAGTSANVIFICGINSHIARNFIKNHYHLNEQMEEYAVNYFKKIFNLSIPIRSIPIHSTKETLKSFVSQLLKSFDWEYDCNKVAEKIANEGSFFAITSIRKYQNIVNNFYLMKKIRPFDNDKEVIIFLSLLIFKEANYVLFKKYRDWIIIIARRIEYTAYFRDLEKMILFEFVKRTFFGYSKNQEIDYTLLEKILREYQL